MVISPTVPYPYYTYPNVYYPIPVVPCGGCCPCCHCHHGHGYTTNRFTVTAESDGGA